MADGVADQVRLAGDVQVLRLLVAGRSVTDIAEELHLSVKTISTHKARMMQKLDISSQADLIRYAISHNLDGAASD